MKKILLSILIMVGCLHVFSQQQIQIRPKALAEGIYDSTKVAKHSYSIYYDLAADSLFSKVLMRDKRLLESELFARYVAQDDGKAVFKKEEWVCEYCPELNYVIMTGGHGFVSGYDLKTLKEIRVNPSTYVYSPSRKYRFGTFADDGMKYYLEIKEKGKYMPHLIHYGVKGDMIGVYWADDETIYYLKEEVKFNGSKHWSAFSTKLYKQSAETVDM